MSEHLEKSTERLVRAISSIKSWAEKVLAELESRHAKYQEGRAEVDKALCELKEQRATFIKKYSTDADHEIGQALDTLTEYIEGLLAEDEAPKAEQRTKASMPQPAAKAGQAQTASQAEPPRKQPLTPSADPADQGLVEMTESEAPEMGEKNSLMREMNERR